MANKKINQLVSKTAILSTDIFGIGDATTGQLFKKTIAELQAAIGGAVISVNGLVGTVVLDTDDIQELATPTNKYFTDARARGAISLTVTGNSGASTYSSGTGVLNVPTYTLAGLGGITATFLSGTSGISYNSTTGVISYSGTVYTDASIRALFSGGTGITYNSSTGAISYSGTVYTDASVRALISMTTTGTSGASTYNNTTGVINVPNYTLAGLGGISLTSLSGGTGITYNNTTGAISYSGTVYTDASVRALISATGNISYNSTTGVISTSLTQYTDALARASVSLTTTGTSGASTYNSTTGVFNIPQYQAVLTNPVTGTGTTNYVPKFTSASAIGNSLIFDNGTNVGIGTTSPFSQGTGATSFEINGTTYAQFFVTANSAAARGTIMARPSDVYIATITNSPLLFGTNDTLRLTIASTGAATFSSSVTANQGLIISKSNDASVQVASFFTGAMTEGQQMYLSYGKSASAAEGFYQVYNHSTTSSSRYIAWQNNAVGPGSQSLVLTSAGLVGIGTTAPDAALTAKSPTPGPYGTGYPDVAVGGNLGNNTALQIYRSALSNGYIGMDSFVSGVGGTQLVLNAANGGNVLIGTTTNNGEKLYVSGTIRATGTITANSDLNLKKNLLKIENALEKVEQINGYTYEFKEDDSKRHAGVIAQEIQTVLPEIVNKGNDGILGVEYGNISALLIEAIKEQNIKIKNLETLLASK